MKVEITDIDTEKVLLSVDGALDVSEGCIDEELLISTEESNYICKLRRGEVVRIIKLEQN